ncbi:hypothetical protein [Kitasatospora sp. NPDC059599]|uniref:hypothetical protein n=1 Tax=Kitasatospora sp. NPDC059599 TaxID=3346880 RepID=UPI0036B211F2
MDRPRQVGEDKDAAWVIADATVVRPLPQSEDAAATQSSPAGDGAARDEATHP